MPDDRSGVTREEIPHGHWFRVGCRLVRVVENTIGGHVIEWKIAAKRSRKRSDAGEIDRKASDGV